jgi:hypothetical protein
MVVLVACGKGASEPAPVIGQAGCHDPAACVATCDQGNPSACHRAAWIYRTGHGVPADAARATHLDDSAARLWSRACDDGYPTACVREARAAMAAKKLDSSSMYDAELLTVPDLHGRGGRALETARTACSQGDTKRCIELDAIEPSPEHAALACKSGDEISCWRAGKPPLELARGRCVGGDDRACDYLFFRISPERGNDQSGPSFIDATAEACARDVQTACDLHDNGFMFSHPDL